MYKKDLSKLSKEDLIKQIQFVQKEREIFIEASDGFWDWHILDDYEYMSPRFWEIFGIDYKTKKHHPSEWRDLIHPEDLKSTLIGFKKHCDTKGDYPYAQEVRYKHSNGSWVTVFCKGCVIEWNEAGEATRMVGTHTDISLLKQALIISKKNLERSNAELEQFASVAAHDIQSPIVTIWRFCQILEEDYKEDLRPEAKEILDIIVESSKKAQTTITDLLDYARAGSSKLNSTSVNLGTLVNETTSALKHLRPNAEVTSENLPTLHIDKNQMGRVFENLIGNGLKFNESSIPAVHVYSTKASDTSWIINIEDNGIGIGARYAEKIFLIFQRLHPSSKFKGTGIGLAVCKRIIENHGGSIWLDSSYTQGSRFCIKLK